MNDNLLGLKTANQEWYLVGFKGNDVVDIDGGHASIEGVTRALKLRHGIWGKEGFDGIAWRACYFVPVPETDVAVNEEAVAVCRAIVQK